MRITRTIEDTRTTSRELGDVALVPTMGALHEGHLSLIHRAKELAEHVAVSIFVNPTQFAPHEDFDRYPRPLDRDLELCRAAGVSMVFAPTVDEMYPPDELETIVEVPSLAEILEGEYRPGFFSGVCRVVAKLLNIVEPRAACFGMKDYQQLRVIEAMTAGLCLPIRIEACPTLREADGLAMSSRNVYLDDEGRKHALGLSKALREAEVLIAEGVIEPVRVERAMEQVMRAHHVEVDYAVVRDARTLGKMDLLNPTIEPVVCLLAGRVGKVRLIDNRLIGSDV